MGAYAEFRIRAHLDTATTAQDVAQGPDREPSSARSAFNCAGSVESVYARHCVRGRCEPRTARGPVTVEDAPFLLSVLLDGLAWMLACRATVYTFTVPHALTCSNRAP